MTTREVRDPVADVVWASGPAQSDSSTCPGQLWSAAADVVQFSMFSFTFLVKAKKTVLASKDCDRSDESFWLVAAASYERPQHSVEL